MRSESRQDTGQCVAQMREEESESSFRMDYTKEQTNAKEIIDVEFAEIHHASKGFKPLLA